ncbi:MAG: tRNA (cytosine(32)/uridine(32)-2'-O)-methyltransferase TrmJ [Alteromonadaceae bacterium]|uniref:tRNA (cytosine(32)/uridine(32)-2'-O)-methyltransferase TrmJ n=1 Tax=Marinobacter sp. BGYM27 TaxID=2975597 RepID=UPI000C4BF2B6|nr:tRNA (cytosine(32)/uridine(32)-2'-O)-methyltransferase TrmJ [Marinobacter sp. BGYM27]MAA63892.1 tRNA (cytosine(32)/uridine(32)-2'-O)-methyltransferase TrmJ [Alteromonadaceae bacterium]MBH85665.1 tRNA (cytosine(32)/uridine(32)-2'-O)-methyltransferase TrmJ [Alteromonadaceae bacterium]MDG5500444.1 tRNA (cytosine(32)/uridine(32)-2'-O)-methyltransferase TrmJ [Marinobacter sp. BGYM27]|tara:strand:- start:32 stop:850 length:819 start_codon:yes stop_codon:yes gene_type:complete
MSATPANPYDNVRIVLVETSHSGNIGAVARGMKNMGLGNLWLVNPASFPDETSYARAAGASDVLDRAQVVDSLDEALAGCITVMGTSARGRKVPWPIMSPSACAEKVNEEAVKGEVALIFGRENHGLSNDELQRCHYHIHIPSNPDYSSLNLAMAVQVVCYELRIKQLEALEAEGERTALQPMLAPGDPGWDMQAATVGEVEGFFGHLEQVLVDIEFHRRENPRQLMSRLRRLFQRARMDKMEINILRGVLSAVQKSAGAPQGQTKAGQDQG